MSNSTLQSYALSHPERFLSFVKKGIIDSEECIDYWCIPDERGDFLLGKQFAFQALSFMKQYDMPQLLPLCVESMFKKQRLTGLEVAFFHTIASCVLRSNIGVDYTI